MSKLKETILLYTLLAPVLYQQYCVTKTVTFVAEFLSMVVEKLYIHYDFASSVPLSK
jgi:hypothetical protein